MDRAGMLLSGICLVHCLLLPVLLVTLPLVGASTLPSWAGHSEWLHILLLVPVLLVSGPALFRGSLKMPWLGAIAAIAFILLVSAVFAAAGAPERLLTMVGAMLLLVAHWINMRQLGAA